MNIRNINVIAREIQQDWKQPNYAAMPYLNAMTCMSKMDDDFYYDNGRSVILYFLSNATTWRGETARRIKAELKSMLAASKR